MEPEALIAMACRSGDDVAEPCDELALVARESNRDDGHRDEDGHDDLLGVLVRFAAKPGHKYQQRSWESASLSCRKSFAQRSVRSSQQSKC